VGEASFVPTNLPGCVLWLRADLGVTLNGTTVSAWADQSGNGNNVSQSTGSAQPTFNNVDSSYNGKSTFSFVSANSQALTGTFTKTQPFTIVLVGHSTNSLLNDEFIFGGSGVGIWTASISDEVTSYAGSVLAAANGTAGTPALMAATFNGATSALYVNSSTAVASGNIGTNNMSSISIGGENSQAHFLDGKMAEVLIYTGALSAAQVNTLFAYLNNRYWII